MKKNLVALLVVSGLAVLIAGCVSTLDGRMKAGVPFQKDRLEYRYERPADQIFAAAKEELQFIGKVTREDTVNKVLEAKVDTRTVWVKVKEVDPKVSSVAVQARTRCGGGDVGLASEVNTRIALRLK
jgi:hypothetical protein